MSVLIEVRRNSDGRS